jgi:hypothetical protein
MIVADLLVWLQRHHRGERAVRVVPPAVRRSVRAVHLLPHGALVAGECVLQASCTASLFAPKSEFCDVTPHPDRLLPVVSSRCRRGVQVATGVHIDDWIVKNFQRKAKSAGFTIVRIPTSQVRRLLDLCRCLRRAMLTSSHVPIQSTFAYSYLLFLLVYSHCAQAMPFTCPCSSRCPRPSGAQQLKSSSSTT